MELEQHVKTVAILKCSKTFTPNRASKIILMKTKISKSHLDLITSQMTFSLNSNYKTRMSLLMIAITS